MNKDNDNGSNGGNCSNEFKYLKTDEYISEKQNDSSCESNCSSISSSSSSISSISSTELENDSKLLSIIETINSLKKFMDNIHNSQISIQKECNRIYGNKFE